MAREHYAEPLGRQGNLNLSRRATLPGGTRLQPNGIFYWHIDVSYNSGRGGQQRGYSERVNEGRDINIDF